MLVSFAAAQDSLNIRKVGGYYISQPNAVKGLSIVGEKLYGAYYYAGIRILDILNPDSLVEIGSYDTPHEALDVAVSGSYAYVADNNSFRIIDVSDPYWMSEVGYLETPEYAIGVAVHGNYAYLADANLGLRIIDVSDPMNPTDVAGVSGGVLGLTIENNYVYLARGSAGFHVIDVTNPLLPEEIGSVDTPGDAYNVAIQGDYAFVADGSSGLRIIDISNPSEPMGIGYFDTGGSTRDVRVRGNFAFITDYDGGIRIIDISNPSSPWEAGYYDGSGYAQCLEINGDYAFVTEWVGGISVYDISYFTSQEPCDPTPLPFIDNFDNPELDSCWYWIREDTSQWSLTERPGWMRIIPLGSIHGSPLDNAENLVLRSLSNINLVAEIKFQQAVAYGASAGLLVYLDDNSCLSAVFLDHGVTNGPVVRVHSELDGSFTYADIPAPWFTVFVRVEKRQNTYSFYASPDSVTWQFVATFDRNLTSGGITRIGMWAEAWDTSFPPADFDYFRVDPLPGTNVCGDISGVWDTTGSPYYVTCDVNVPAGQTLEIQPGVEVLFTGHYKFNVNGNLQAIGTEQDSIVFTRAFPTEESKWDGIRFNAGSDASDLSYCVIERVLSSDHGGVSIESCSPRLVHCAIRHNQASGGWGAGVYCGSSTASFTDCAIEHNSATAVGGVFTAYGAPTFLRCEISHNTTSGPGGGSAGLFFYYGSPQLTECAIDSNWSAYDAGGIGASYSTAILTKCVISNNFAETTGGGIQFHFNPLTFINCIVFGNNANGSGGGISSSGVSASIINTIVWGNTAPSSPSILGDLSVTYSDIQGGYPGAGNIDANPMFVDAENGNHHLLWNSPCIDVGNPSSQLDPDGTIADMGAFAYDGPRLRLLSPDGGEEWHVFQTDTVRWSGYGVTNLLRIELNRHYPLDEWELLLDDVVNDGEEPVFVNDPLSDSCRIRISAIGDIYEDSSSADFSIVSSQGYLALVLQSQPATPILSWNAGTRECPETSTALYRMKNFGSENIVVFAPEPVSGIHFNLFHNCPPFFALAPGQMSSYNVTLTYDPQAEGNHCDTLRMQTDAVNAIGGNVRIPLSGSQTRTPDAPQVVIQTQGQDARLSWDPVSQSIGECSVTATEYLLFFSQVFGGPYWYLWHTTDTSFVHSGVVHHAPSMYYHVYASTAPLMLLSGLPPNVENPRVSEEQVLEMLRQRSISVELVGEQEK